MWNFLCGTLIFYVLLFLSLTQLLSSLRDIYLGMLRILFLDGQEVEFHAEFLLLKYTNNCKHHLRLRNIIYPSRYSYSRCSYLRFLAPSAFSPPLSSYVVSCFECWDDQSFSPRVLLSQIPLWYCHNVSNFLVSVDPSLPMLLLHLRLDLFAFQAFLTI